VKGHPGPEQIDRLRRGITIDNRRTAPAEVELIDTTDRDNAWYRIVLVQGRNQQIRKMFDAIHHSVVKLRRVQIGPVDDAGLALGKWRTLTEAEVKRLMAADRKHQAATATKTAPVGKPGGPTRRSETKRPPRAGAKPAGPKSTGGRPPSRSTGAPRRNRKS
jgi:23S rRNA pseudouridine2605 synthase